MSQQLIELQKKCGVTPDGNWGPITFKAAMKYYKLSPIRAAHFFGNTAHETGDFNVFFENLNYSARGLMKTWPKIFPNLTVANQYAHNQQAIANRAYGGRMGNGNEASGDGWKFRGRGAIQYTGKNNYQRLTTHLNRPDLIINPDPIGIDLAFESAIFFFEENHIWSICDHGIDINTITKVRKLLNGGTIGLDDVIIRVQKYFTWA